MKASALRSSMLPCHAERTVEDGGFGGGMGRCKVPAAKEPPVESIIGC